MNLDMALQMIGLVMAAAQPYLSGSPDAAAVDKAAAALVAIAQKANAAHMAIAGSPIDLNALQPIEPLPEG